MIPLKEDWGGGGGGNPCFYSQDSASITKPWRAPKLINQGCCLVSAVCLWWVGCGSVPFYLYSGTRLMQ